MRLLDQQPAEDAGARAATASSVTGRIPHVIPPNEHNRFYLETKATRSGHFIDFEGKPHVSEQGDPVVVIGKKNSCSGVLRPKSHWDGRSIFRAAATRRLRRVGGWRRASSGF